MSHPDQPSTVVQPKGITFLRSTTTTTTTREADGASKTRVRHAARFDIEAGTVADQTHRYGTQTFRPLWMTATWNNSVLAYVRVTGRRVLKDGRLQQPTDKYPNADISRENHWGWEHDDKPLDRDRLPEPIPAALAAYELAVAARGADVGRSAI